MSFVQVPPAPGSSGQNIESFVVTSSQHRQALVVADAASTAVAPVSSSGGLSVAVTNPSTAVSVANTPTVVSASSGLVQISGTPTVLTASSGHLGRFLSSGIVTLSSVHTVTATGPVTITSGLISVTSGTVTATAATNPWSSAPGFNVPVVSVSSGLVQISGTATIVSASSGLIQTLVNVTTSTPELAAGLQVLTMTTDGRLRVNSSAGGAGSTSVDVVNTPTVTIVGTSGAIAPATSSGGLGVTILAGSGAGSTAINIVGSSNAAAPATSSGGLSVTFVNTAGPVTTSAGAYINLVTTAGVAYPGSTVSGVRVAQGASNILATSTGPWIVDLRNQVYSSVPQFVEVSATSSGHVSIVSAVSSMRIFVLGYALIADTSNTMIWESSNTDLSGTMLFSTAGTGLVCPVVAPGHGAWMATSVNGDLGILQGNAGTIAGHLTYYTASS